LAERESRECLDSWLATADRWGSRLSLVASNSRGEVVALQMRLAAINGNSNR
jgi:hypothetical protein